MKKVIRLILVTLVLTGAMSTTMMADGGPSPMCPDGRCLPR